MMNQTGDSCWYFFGTIFDKPLLYYLNNSVDINVLLSLIF